MQKSIKSIGTSYGLYLGLILSVIFVLIYAFHLELFTKWWLNILNFIVVIVISILAVTQAKKLNTTYFSFKEAFSTYFITVAIGLIISSAVGLLIFNVVDPGAAEQVSEMVAETMREMLEKFGTPQEDIDKALAEMEAGDQFSPVNYLKGLAFQLAFYAVIGLIIALIFREKNPDNFNA